MEKKDKYGKQEVMEILGITNTTYHRWKHAGKLVVQPAQKAYVTYEDLQAAKKLKQELDKGKGAK